MNYLLPPYGKRHIIILASLTFFIGIGLLFAWKLQLSRQSVTQTAIKAQDLRNKDDLAAPFTLAQLGNQSAAWGDNHFIFYDIRSAEDYDKAHLEGAVSVPLEWLDRTAISHNATVVIYSDSLEQLDQAKTIFQNKHVGTIYTLNEPLSELAQRGFIVYEP